MNKEQLLLKLAQSKLKLFTSIRDRASKECIVRLEIVVRNLELKIK